MADSQADQGSGTATRAFVSALLGFLAAAGAYFGALHGTDADPALWANPLPPNSSDALDQARTTLLQELDAKLLEDHLRTLDSGNHAGATRKLHEFCSRIPAVRYAVAGVLIRKSEALRAGGKAADAIQVARGATVLAEDDFRAWSELAAAQGAAGAEAEATAATQRAVEARAQRPLPQGADYAKGVGGTAGLALVVFCVVFAAMGRSGGGPGPAAGPGPASATGETTIGGGVMAPTAEELGLEEGEATGGQITRVLGAEERLDQARLFLEERQWGDAQRVFRAATKLNPASAKKIAVLCVDSGKAFYEGKQIDEARRCFQLAVEHDPKNKRAQTYLANCLVKAEDFSTAVQHYLEVCSLDPQGAIGFYNLGICYEKTKQLDQAVKAFEHALRLEPNMANAHFYLARIHEAEKNPKAAIEHWTRCAQIAPGTPQAQRAQQRLQALTGTT